MTQNFMKALLCVLNCLLLCKAPLDRIFILFDLFWHYVSLSLFSYHMDAQFKYTGMV